MGNLCAIFHTRFKHLINIIPSARKAQLLDYILLGWQTSTYTLRNSDKKWFMKPYSEIVSDTGIPKSTLMRYIKELADDGFIVRRQALYSRNQENKGFEVKKGAYIHVTDKLLVLLKSQTSTATPKPPEETISEKPVEKAAKSLNLTPASASIAPVICTNFTNNENIDPLKMRGLYIRDLYSSLLNNTISFKNKLQSVDKSVSARLQQQFETIRQFLEEEIQEEIPLEAKKLVLATFFNLSFEHQKSLSSPKQVAAEYLFALANVDFYMPEVKTFAHRNNILAKLIREDGWKTPKGFYKYCYLGSEFQNSATRQETIFQEKLARELLGITCPKERFAIQARLEAAFAEETHCVADIPVASKNPSSAEVKALKTALELLRQEIFHEGEYLARLESMPDREDFAVQNMREATQKRLETFYKQQITMESQLDRLEGNDFALCA